MWLIIVKKMLKTILKTKNRTQNVFWQNKKYKYFNFYKNYYKNKQFL